MAIKDTDDDDGIFDDSEDDDDAPPKPGSRERDDEEDEPESEDDEGERVEVPPPRPNRAERRAQRRRSYVADTVREVVTEVLGKAEETHRETIQALISAPPVDSGEKPKSPIEREIEMNQREQQLLIREFNAKPLEEQKTGQAAAEARLAELRSKEMDLRVDLRTEQRESAVREEAQRRQQAAANDPVMRAMRSKYADVFADPVKQARARAIYWELRGAGAPPTAETMDKAYARARDQRGGGARYDDRAARSRLSGTTRGGGSGNSPSAPRTILKEEQKMATTMYPGVPVKEAVAKWLKIKAKGEAKRAGEKKA